MILFDKGRQEYKVRLCWKAQSDFVEKLIFARLKIKKKPLTGEALWLGTENLIKF